VRVLKLNPRCTDTTLATEAAKDPSLASLPFVDVDEATFPNDRSKRDKWRVQGQSVVVDNAVSDQPHPKQEFLNRVRNTTSLEQLKKVIEDLILDK